MTKAHCALARSRLFQRSDGDLAGEGCDFVPQVFNQS